ncbi:MAG: hypothetical protein AAFR99_11485 [Cyanobacteria bacterium J06629_9]
MFLVADLAVPGWGKFPNPVFYGQWAYTEATGAAQKRFEVNSVTDPADTRLTPCQNDSVANEPGSLPVLTDAQAALRENLTGKSSVIAVQQLGTPVCQLTDGSWRWLLESGLSLDVQVAEDGTIDHATLTR